MSLVSFCIFYNKTNINNVVSRRADDALDLIWAAWSKMLHDIAISPLRQASCSGGLYFILVTCFFH